MSNRDDFPLAARTLAVLERQEGRENPTSLKATENEKDHLMKNCDHNLSGKAGIIGKSAGRRHHLHLRQIGGSQENGMNHNEKNGKISNDGKSGKYSLSEPSTFLQESCTFVVFFFFFTFRVLTFANVVHATGCEDSTPRTRDTDAHFFSCCAHVTVRAGHVINAHALAQGHVDCLSLRAHQKSLVRLMLRRTLLDVPDRFPSFCSTPPPTQSSLLNTGMSMNRCATPSGSLFFGRVAEQSLLTGYETKSLIEVSSEHTPINFPSRKGSFNSNDLTTTVAASGVTDTIEVGQLTSPLFSQEREVSASPSVSLIFSSSKHLQVW